MKISAEKIVLFMFVMLCALSARTQTQKAFSGDPLKFTTEVQDLFAGITSPTIGIKVRELLNPFIETWDANLYNEEEKAFVISNANTLLSRKMTNYPDLYHYFSVIHNLKKKGNRNALIYFSQDLEKRVSTMTQRRMQAYLEQYKLLASDNILYQSSTFIWYISDTSLHLEYDTAIRVTYRFVDLTCATKKDTSRIFNTEGVFYPGEIEWEGKKGRVTWARVGFNPDSVYADLSDYRINMKMSEYRADTVKMTNKRYFKTPLYGRLIEKVLASPPGPSSTYPQFVSYLRNYEIPDLFKDIDYRGGFSVEGAKVIGSGEVNENALLIITQNGKVKAQIRSVAFRILGDQISANPASLSILTNGDSIFHPGLQLKYFDDKRQLVMYRPESGISQSPFFDGFHEIDMDCGALYWSLDSNFISFESVPSYNRISANEFVSNNFFSEYEFDKIQGIDEKNPLYVIRNYCRDYGTDEVSPEALAQYMRMPVDQMQSLLMKLSIMGFLYYDLVNDK
ncbi:MAG: hypothetical protein HGA23_06580, partial [Bacteroidales bacterium]|nr:hypothetical protein [Bacteroidales bacterium]